MTSKSHEHHNDPHSPNCDFEQQHNMQLTVPDRSRLGKLGESLGKSTHAKTSQHGTLRTSNQMLP
jgi:hypothetical protein